MPYKATWNGIVNREGHVDQVQVEAEALFVGTVLVELVSRLMAKVGTPGITRTWPKLVLSGTLTVTIEREPSAAYDETMARLREKQKELARKEGIVEIASEGG